MGNDSCRWEVPSNGCCLLWGCLCWFAGGLLFTQRGGCRGWWMPHFTLPLAFTALTCGESSKGTILPISWLALLSLAMRAVAPVRIVVGRVRAFLHRTWATLSLLISVLFIRIFPLVLPFILMHGTHPPFPTCRRPLLEQPLQHHLLHPYAPQTSPAS